MASHFYVMTHYMIKDSVNGGKKQRDQSISYFVILTVPFLVLVWQNQLQSSEIVTIFSLFFMCFSCLERTFKCLEEIRERQIKKPVKMIDISSFRLKNIRNANASPDKFLLL